MNNRPVPLCSCEKEQSLKNQVLKSIKSIQEIYDTKLNFAFFSDKVYVFNLFDASIMKSKIK